MNKPIIMLGNGGHASVLTEILLAQGEEILGFTALSHDYNCFDLSYLGTDEIVLNYQPSEVALVLAFGMVKPSLLRENIFRFFSQKGFQFKSVIHPTAIIAPSAKLGQSVQVMAGSVIQTNTIIADNTIVNTGALIDHDCQIESHVHIAPGVRVSGNVHIGTGTHIGTGATVIQGIKIGTSCLIGAGAVVIKNIANNKKAVGVPAKEV